MPVDLRKIGLGLVALVAVGSVAVWKMRGRDVEAPLPTVPSSVPVYRSRSYTITQPREPVFSPDSRYVACRQPASNREQPGELLVFDTEKGTQTSRVKTSREVSLDLSWPLPQRLALSGSWAQSWKVSAGRAVPVKLFQAPGPFSMPVKISPTTIFSSANKSIQWQNTPKVLAQGITIAPQHQMGARMLSDQRQEGVDARFVEIFDTKSGKRVSLFRPANYSPSSSRPFLWSPAGEPRLLVSEYIGEYEVAASAWEARTGKPLWKIKFPGYNVRWEWTPEGRFVVATRVTGSHGRDIYPLHDAFLLDARTGRVLRKLETQPSVRGTAVSNRYLMCVGSEMKPGKSYQSQSWSMTDLQTGKRVLRTWGQGLPSHMDELAISPDNRFVAGTSGDGFMLWKVADLKKGTDKPRVLSEALSVESE